MNHQIAKYWIEKLNLEAHPEGGFFREVLRSNELYQSEAGKNLYTSIYYLLSGYDFSAFHRLNMDEIWYYHTGTGLLEVVIIEDENRLKVEKLGVGEGAVLSIIIPKGKWFAARLPEEDTFVVSSCAVIPGFDFSEFEMAERDHLIKLYPNHKKTIEELTR